MDSGVGSLDGVHVVKIALVSNEYPSRPGLGGIGVFTHTLAHGLSTRGHCVTVVGVGPNAGEDDDQGIRVVTLRQSSRRGIAWLANRIRLHRWLKAGVANGEIDVIETPEHSGMLPFRLSGCPVVIRLHMAMTLLCRSAGLKPPILVRRLERRTLSSHRNWIAVSDYVRRQTMAEFKVTPDRSTVIYNAIEPLTERVAPPAGLPEHFVLYAGEVREQKGAFVLAEAARSFLSAFPDLHLVYCGSLLRDGGAPADGRIRQIVGSELANRVHCLGFQEHAKVMACMERARLLACPSKLEACSLVPIEAMTCGVPVLHTYAAGGPEVVVDGVTGLLADPEDSRDVAEKVIRILRDRELAQRLAGRAKERLNERFSLDRCIAETVSFYEAVRASR
ncbi:MAG: glycosyltransferase family 4 protein [Thermoguttaceae bacterium]